MSASPHEERRPAQSAAWTSSNPVHIVGLPACPCLEDVDHLDDSARAIDGAFVVVVKVTGGKHRRRTYLAVSSAQRAADNARRAGHTATVYLAELRPLWRVGGDAR